MTYMKEMAANFSETKTCTKCGTERNLSEFNSYVNKVGKTQHKSYCKPCSRLQARKWYSDNYEKALEYRREYYDANPEKYSHIPYSNRMTETGVYMFKNIITGEIYIGAAKNMPRRVSRHFAPRGRNRNKYIYKSVKQYGKQAHVWGVLEYCDTMKEAFERETYYISIYQPQWNTLKVTK